MKAVILREYGGPEVLKYEDYPDPKAGAGEVLVRVAATSVNPFDTKIRSGSLKDMMPLRFPYILGLDVSGTVEAVGDGVRSFAAGDRVIAQANATYAELCVVSERNLSRLPDGLDPVEAGALPTVVSTGSQLITRGAKPGRGQTVLVSGAVGNVGRSAVFTAKQLGATVIAGVRKKQLEQAAATGADSTVAIDDEAALASLASLDAVADTVGGRTAEALIAKVKPGGRFASVLGPPSNAGQFPKVTLESVYVQADPASLFEMAEAVRGGKLSIPIARRIALSDAAGAQSAIEKGLGGKVLLIP